MIDSQNNGSGQEMRNLSLAYLEGLLTPEEESEFEKYLEENPDFSDALEEMRQWAGVLQENKKSFCPEPWELFDHARKNEEPPLAVSAHLQLCETCRTLFEKYRAAPLKQGLPAQIRARVSGASDVSSKKKGSISLHQWFSSLAEKWFELFRIPILVPATIGAAVLLVVLLIPTRGPEFILGTSSDKWEPTKLERNLMGALAQAPPTAEKLATVILFRGLKQEPAQENVDALYRELRPTPKQRSLNRIITPAQISSAVGKDQIRTANRDLLFKDLHEKLGASRVVVIALRKQGDRYQITGQLADAATGKVLRSVTVKDVISTELPAKVREASSKVMESE